MSKFTTVFSLLAGILFIGACTSQSQMDKHIDDYFERKGVEQVKKAIDQIVEQERAKRRGPSLDEKMANRVDVPLNGAPVKGAEDAPITIVEFSDFECPFCSRVLPTIDQVMKEYKGKVKLAFRHNPLPFHKNAVPAHKAAMAAQEQGKFWEYHDKLFQNQKALTQENFVKWAKELGLNVEQFKKDMEKSAYEKRMKEDMQFAKTHGATGTPAFFINGVKVVGARPFDSFKEVIDALLAEKG